MYTNIEIGGMSLVTLFSLASVATTVLFIVYASEWAENDDKNMAATTGDATKQQNRLAMAEYSFYATVILILMIITGMHGFIIARELL